MEIVALQQEFRLALPNIYGAIDYRDFREQLIKIDEILTQTDLEHELVSEALRQLVKTHGFEAASFFQSKKASFH